MYRNIYIERDMAADPHTHSQTCKYVLTPVELRPYELSSKLLASPTIATEILPGIIPFFTSSFKEFRL